MFSDEAQTPDSISKRLYSRYRYYSLPLRSRLHRVREAVIRRIVWTLPREIVYWSVIRVWSQGTTRQWGNTHPDELTWGEALKRWNTQRKG